MAKAPDSTAKRVDGIRIRPQPDRVVPDNAMIVIRDISRPFKEISDKAPCGICKIPHYHKTYHLQLRAGSVIVSPTVWRKLQNLVDDGGMEYVNPVAEPPAQGIAIEQNGAGEVTLIEKYVPPIHSM